MISKNSYWNLSKSNFKRRIPFLVLGFLLCFLSIPVIMYFQCASYAQGIENYDYKYIVQSLVRDIALGGYLQDAIVIALAIAFAITGNAWNNSQKKNDFYKSLPVKENTRFAYIHVNSFISFLICFVCNIILANLVVAGFGFYEKVFMVATGYSIMIHSLEFCAVYMVAVIAQYLTGNSVFAICGTGVLSVFEPAMRMLMDTFREICYKTYVHTFFDYSEYMCDNFTSPVSGALAAHESVSRLYNDFYAVENYSGIWPSVVKMLIQIVVYTAIAFYIYNKRPAQAGNKNIVFEKSKPFIKAIIMIPVTLAAVILVMENVEDRGVPAFIGMIIAIVILHIVLQFSIEGDFAAVKRGWISTILAGSCVAVIAFGLIISGRIFDKQKLASADIESVGICSGDEYRYNFYEADESHSYIPSSQYFLYDVKIKDETFIRELTDIINKNIDAGKYYYDPNWTSKEKYSGFDVCFNMKNGKQIVKSYLIPLEDYRKIIYDIFNLEEYKHAANQLENDNNKHYVDDASKLRIEYCNYGFSSYDICGIEDKAIQKEMLEALSKDFVARTADVYSNEIPVGYVEIDSVVSKGIQPNFTYQIYEGDVNTYAVLEKIGCVPHKLDKSRIVKIEVFSDRMVEETGTIYTADDKEFADLVDKIVLSDAFFKSVLSDREIYDAFIYSDEGNRYNAVVME